jgi:O-antigen/teichoic acid export membrane protein
MPFTRKHIISSFVWKYLEQCSTHAVQLAIGIVLARLLMPNDFGLVALVAIFISMANVFVASGLNSALIQKKDADVLDFSSVFWLSLGIAFFVYAVLFFTAPLIANFYEKEVLVSIVRIQSLTLFIGVFNSIQGVIIAKNLLFKKMFYRSIIVSIPTGIFGISLAYNGFGVWSLVWQQMLDSVLMYIFMQFIVKWKPTLNFSYKKARELLSFGGKLLVAQIINSFQENLHNAIIGKIFSPIILAFYVRGTSFPSIIINNINTSLNSVLFPVLSSIQEDKERVKNMVKKSIILSTYVITPLMAILAVISEPLVKISLGEKWLPAVPFMQVYCFIYALWPLHTTNLAPIHALGKSEIILIQQIFKLLFHLLAILICVLFFKSAIYLALIMAIASCFNFVINAIPNKKLINYRFSEQVMDILPNFLLSLLIVGVLLPLSLLKLNEFVIIFIQIFVGLGFYAAFSKLFKVKGLFYILELRRI